MNVVPTSHGLLFDDGAAPFTCSDRRDEAPGVVTFGLMPAGAPGEQGPGQCVTVLWTMPDGTTAPRTFTIASAPQTSGRIEITVKRGGSGGATADMQARLIPGMAMSLRGPSGAFGPIAAGATGKLLLIGAGSGATPAMAALRQMRAEERAVEAVYIHAASTPADFLFRAELEAMAADMSGLVVILLASRVPPGVAFMGPRGRLDRRMLCALVPDLRDRDAFVCGPAGFMDTVRAALRSSGFAMDRYHEERFHPRDAPAPTTRQMGACGTATLTASGREVPLGAGMTLLESLGASGIVVPTGCRQGLCGTCRIRLTKGDVAMTDRGTLTKAQKAAGDVLACCSHPRGDLEIEL